MGDVQLGEHERTEGVLRMRYCLYAYVSRAFAQPPDRALFGLIHDSAIAELCGTLRSGDESGADVQQCIRAACDADWDSVRACYTPLFEGPGRLPVPLWESAYASHEGLLFTERTLQVRQAYARQGFRAAGYPHEPDDHVATELSFMAHLAAKTVQVLSVGGLTECSGLVAAQREFLNAHLGTWIGAFAEAMVAHEGGGSFYGAFARLACLLCSCDVGYLDFLQR